MEEEKVITFDYKGVSTGRAFAAHLFDFFTLIVLGALILIGTLFVMFATPVYKDANARRNQIQISSHLYVESEGDMAVLLSKKLDADNNLSYSEKNEQLSSALHYFFDTFLVERSNIVNSPVVYTKYLLEYKTSKGEKMFDENRTRLVKEAIYDKEYFTAYYQVCNAHAIGYVAYVGDYIEVRRAYIFCYVFAILIALSLSSFILFFIVPLLFSRGRRTFGMVLNHTGYVSYDGFSPSFKRFVLHFLFKWILVVLGSSLAFLIPVFISVTMLFLNKNHQCLSEYVLGCFMVVNDQDFIYNDYQDYERVVKLRQEAIQHPLSDHLNVKK